MVVQGAAGAAGRDIAWPELTERLRALFRAGAEQVLQAPAEWVEELHAAALAGARAQPIAADPVLAEGARRSNLANLLHWAAANIEHPGERVPPALGPEVLEVARDLVRRGLDERGLDSYRTAQAVAWRRWMEICFRLTDDVAELRTLLEVSSLSITTFLDDTIAALAATVEAEREELTSGTNAERRATVALLLEGAPVPRARAEQALGHGLAGPHLAAVVWSAAAGRPEDLEQAAELLLRATGAARRLTVVASAGALWLWLPVAAAPEAGALHAGLRGLPGVRVALGRPAQDLAGFRSSHLEAVATQQLLSRLGSSQQLARWDDVQLAALVTADAAATDAYVADVLGDLRDADAETRDTVLTWIRTGGATSRTAELLFAHRNTVVRRLARADALLPRPLEEDLLGVGVALEVLRWRG